MEKKNRKDWIKNVAIVFLVVLLLLTFFSNTIQNYSLPEVSAQYCMSGQITNKVRGTGMVESTDPYSVEYKETRKISSVNVRVGDYVEKGDILYYLEEGENEELKTAEKTLATLQSTYERAIINGNISSSVVSNVENEKGTDFASQQKALENVRAKIEKAQANVDKYQAQIDQIDEYIQVWEDKTDNSITEIKGYNDAMALVDKYQTDMDQIEHFLGTSNDRYKEVATQQFNALRDAEAFQATINVNIANLKRDRASVDKSLTAAKEKLLDATNALTELSDKYSTYQSLEDMIAGIRAQEAVVENLRNQATSTEIVAPVSGTVLALSYVAGETTVNGSQAASIQLAGKGYTLSFTVPNDQARLLSIGDEAEVTNSWWYSDVHGRISAIRPSPTSPSTSKLVVFDIEGDVTNGQSLTLTVGKRTSNYDYIVPTSAIREDNNGKFVLKVNSKNTPLGTRYSAERVNVTVLAEDDSQSAISGDLEGWEYIITNSSKPVEDGQLIRLKEY